MAMPILFALLIALTVSLPVLPAYAGEPQKQTDEAIWTQLHRMEVEAFRDFAHHVSTADVPALAEALWVFSRTPDVRRLPCAQAAEMLSYMVGGLYTSVRRLEIAYDWHHFAPWYRVHRQSCLRQLAVDETRFPLPDWFIGNLAVAPSGVSPR
jgi:hypothetical protein